MANDNNILHEPDSIVKILREALLKEGYEILDEVSNDQYDMLNFRRFKGSWLQQNGIRLEASKF
jgi:hypothetical protein